LVEIDALAHDHAGGKQKVPIGIHTDQHVGELPSVPALLVPEPDRHTLCGHGGHIEAAGDLDQLFRGIPNTQNHNGRRVV
jgi:hypothetical protein